MKRKEFRWRPAYFVEPHEPDGWRVTRKGDPTPIGVFDTRRKAIRLAKIQAGNHIVAQVVIFRKDGSFEKDHGILNPKKAAIARQLLEQRLSQFQKYNATDSFLSAYNHDYALNEDVVIEGETVRLTICIHEGSMYDEIYVSGKIWDEFYNPVIAEISYTLWFDDR